MQQIPVALDLKKGAFIEFHIYGMGARCKLAAHNSRNLRFAATK